MQKRISFNVTVVSVKRNDYRIHFGWYVSKE